HRAYDGGAAEVSQVTGAMTALQEIAGERTFLLAGDSKLISYPNVRDMAGAKVTFIGPAPKQHVPAAVLARLAVIGKTRRVAGYLTTTTGTDPGTGKPTLQWGYDQAALETESATDGWYALLTTLDPAEAGTPDVLLRFKGQEASERRYGNYKGPLAVAPMFLQHNRRIAALITVICLALLVFSLAGRQVRAQIAPAAKIPGLYADRPARPTG